MTLGAWKLVEKSGPYRRGKLILRRLAGQELWLLPDMAARPELVGGWVYRVDALGADSVVYSLGVGDDITFDLALIAQFGLHVHAFDPIPSVASWLRTRQDLPHQFHFHQWAVAGEDTTLTLRARQVPGSAGATMYTAIEDAAAAEEVVEAPAYSLTSSCRMLEHERVDLLKVDIEGAEYEVLSSMLQSTLRPTQVLVEFHHRFKGVALQHTMAAIDQLLANGYELFAVSDSGREYCFCLQG